MGLAQAAVLTEFGQAVAIEEIDLAEPGPHEVVIRVMGSGICHSDRSAQQGLSPRAPQTPIVLGHEVSGVVEHVGTAVQSVRRGDSVVVCAASSCGTCSWCSRGLDEMCVSMQRERPAGEGSRLSRLGSPLAAFVGIGGHASKVLVHEQAVVPIPASMPFEPAALLGCAVHTGIGAVRHTAAVLPGESVVVIGCGGVGLNVIQGARLAGASMIIGIDVDTAKVEKGLEFGATLGFVAGEEILATVTEETGGGADHVFDVVGRTATMEQALQLVRPVGNVTVLGLPPAGVWLRLGATDLFAEKRVQGHRMGRGSRVDIPWYCQRYLAGDLLLDELISRVIPLQDVNAGLDTIEDSVGRIVIRGDDVPAFR